MAGIADLRPRADRPDVVAMDTRRRVLRGMPAVARRIVAGLLDTYAGWDDASLHMLRSYGLSCARLAALEAADDPDSRPIHREVRTNLQLHRSLNLEDA